MSALTSRQAEILRLVLQLGRPNVNDLIRKRQSPSKLKENLEDLVGKHCLRMDREGNEHHYKITKPGLRSLAKRETDEAGVSLGSLHAIQQDGGIEIDPQQWAHLVEQIKRLGESVTRLQEIEEAHVDTARILTPLFQLKNSVGRATEAGLIPKDLATEWRQMIASIDAIVKEEAARLASKRETT